MQEDIDRDLAPRSFSKKGKIEANSYQRYNNAEKSQDERFAQELLP